MSEVTVIINELREIGMNPDKSVAKAIAETGKEAIGCFPIYTPEEIVYAAGFLPVGLWGGPTELKLADKYLQGFCCSIMRANIEYAMKGTYNILKGVVLSTFCDTLKCICENWKVAAPQIPIIPVVYPQHRNIQAGRIYLIEELERVKKELEALSGKTIREEELTVAFEIYEKYRREMRRFIKLAGTHLNTIDVKTRHLVIKAGYFMDKKTCGEMMERLNKGLESMPEEKFPGIKLIATGLMSEPNIILDVMAENNIAIVADDLSQESRSFRVEAPCEGSVIERMAARIVEQRGCTFLYEEAKSRGEILIKMKEEFDADGIVVLMMKFCDPEEFDYPIYKKEIESAEIPLLYVETELQMKSAEQVRTRFQSFFEMLRF